MFREQEIMNCAKALKVLYLRAELGFVSIKALKVLYSRAELGFVSIKALEVLYSRAELGFVQMKALEVFNPESSDFAPRHCRF